MTQTDLASLIGVSQKTISRWERGEDQPTAERQKQLRDLGWKPVSPLLATLGHAVRFCPAPRALSRTRDMCLCSVSGAAIAKRPSVTDWVGKSLKPIATGVLAEILDDREVRRALERNDIATMLTTTRSVLNTGDPTNFGVFHTTISYFVDDGDVYSDAISVAAPDDAPCGYRPIYRDEIVERCQI